MKPLLFLIKLKYGNFYHVLPELSILINDKKYIPDLSIYKKEELDFKTNETSVKNPPIGAIEILSEQQPTYRLTNKLEKYLAAGMKSYWLVLPELRSIYVFNTSTESKIFGKKDILRDDILTIELDLKEVFEGM